MRPHSHCMHVVVMVHYYCIIAEDMAEVYDSGQAKHDFILVHFVLFPLHFLEETLLTSWSSSVRVVLNNH